MLTSKKEKQNQPLFVSLLLLFEWKPTIIKTYNLASSFYDFLLFYASVSIDRVVSFLSLLVTVSFLPLVGYELSRSVPPLYKLSVKLFQRIILPNSIMDYGFILNLFFLLLKFNNIEVEIKFIK